MRRVVDRTGGCVSDGVAPCMPARAAPRLHIRVCRTPMAREARLCRTACARTPEPGRIAGALAQLFRSALRGDRSGHLRSCVGRGPGLFDRSGTRIMGPTGGGRRDAVLGAARWPAPVFGAGRRAFPGARRLWACCAVSIFAKMKRANAARRSGEPRAFLFVRAKNRGQVGEGGLSGPWLMAARSAAVHAQPARSHAPLSPGTASPPGRHTRNLPRPGRARPSARAVR